MTSPARIPADRWGLVRQLVLANAIVLLLILTLRPYVERLYGLRAANDWGSDWRWLQDGLDRLAAGLALTRPEYVAGPWSQFPSGQMIPTYAWSLHPPYSAALYAPFLLIPDEFRAVGWTAVMAVALAAAVWLGWPRRLWWGTGVLIVVGMLRLTGSGAWPGVIDQLHYANPNALVALGVVLTWLGRRRGSVPLMAAGLVLASVKIVPAVTLGFWLLIAREGPIRPRQAIAAALVVLVALTIPVLLLDHGAITDLIASQANLIPWAGPQNLAPRLLLVPLLGSTAATVLCYGAGLVLIGMIVVWRLDGPGGLVLAASAALVPTAGA